MEIQPERESGRGPEVTQNGLSIRIRGLEPKKVLEVYVKRSLSLREGDIANREVKRRQTFPVKKSEKGTLSPARGQSSTQEELTISASKNRGSGEEASAAVSNCLSSEDGPGKDGKKGKKPQTFLGKFVSFLWKRRSEERKEAGCKGSKESIPDGCLQGGQNGGSRELFEGHKHIGTSTGTHKAKIRKRRSIRRVFSFKRSSTEESKGSTPRNVTGARKIPAKPTQLDLRDIYTPSNGQTDPKPEYLYEQVSEEMEQIVRAHEPGVFKLKGSQTSSAADSADDETIRKIVGFLRKEGDRMDAVLKENAEFSTFFKEMNYVSFKQLADQYVQTEVNTKTDRNPEVTRFAFTLDLTAKVAGVCGHAVNRIMGYGTQYVQDSFERTSRHWQEVENEIQSPD
eukprot:gi/632967091/ref/XP_007899787.1/ PREDICTED: uncharacterized protein LOC103183872 [Callorhinchus milii]